MVIVTSNQLHTFLLKQGFQYEEYTAMYRKVLPDNELQLRITVKEFNKSEDDPRKTVSLGVIGEYRRGTWTKLEVFNLSWQRVITELHTLTEDLLRAWNALCLEQNSLLTIADSITSVGDTNDHNWFAKAPRNGLLCSVCHTPQVTIPSGDTCVNGHGGADGHEG